MSERQRTSTTTSTESGFHLNRTHIFRAIASVVIATLLWGWITQVNDPIKKQELQNFNLQAPTLSDRLVVVTSLPQIRIDLEGPDSTIGDIRRSDLTARLDTSLVSGPGDYSLPVVVEGPEGSYEKKADPDKIAVRVEAIKSREIPLTIHKEFVNGDVSRIEDVIPDSSTVTITGPSSAVDRVDKVILPVSVNTDATQLRGSFEPYAVDKDNQRVTEVTILPANIQTTVELSQPGRSVSVIPDIVGTPAEGYSILQKAAIPETIVVDGPPEVIDTLLFVNTEPVDISGAD